MAVKPDQVSMVTRDEIAFQSPFLAAAVSDIRAPRRIQGPAGLSDQGAGVAGLPGAHFRGGISHGRRSRGNELGILRTDSDPGGGSGFDQPVSKDGADRLSQRTRHNWSADRTRWGPRCR